MIKYNIYMLLAATVCFAIGSCSGEESASVPEVPDVPVSFFATANEPAVRAGTGGLTTANLASMGVFGYYTKQSLWAIAASTAVPNFMNNERIAKSGGAWTYSPVKYWPNTTGDKLTFFAYAPHSSDAYNDYNGEGVYDMTTDVGELKIHFHTPAKEKEQIDLLAATGLLNRTHSNAQLTFAMRHMLTKVEFRVKSSSDITVSMLWLVDIAALAYLEFDKTSGEPQIRIASAPDDEGYSGANAEAYLGSSGSIDVPASEDPAVPGTTVATFYLPPFKPERAVFKYSDEPSATIIYLPGDELWKSGEHVIYTIVIEKTKLSVTVSKGLDDGKWTSGGKEDVVDDSDW